MKSDCEKNKINSYMHVFILFLLILYLDFICTEMENPDATGFRRPFTFIIVHIS